MRGISEAEMGESFPSLKKAHRPMMKGHDDQIMVDVWQGQWESQELEAHEFHVQRSKIYSKINTEAAVVFQQEKNIEPKKKSFVT